MSEICPECLELIQCGYCSCTVANDSHLSKRDTQAARHASRRRMQPDKLRRDNHIFNTIKGRRRKRRRRRSD